MGQMTYEDANFRTAHPQTLPEGPVFTYSHPDQSRLRRRLIRAVERLSGQSRIERLYRDWRDDPAKNTGAPVFAEAMRARRAA